MKPLASVLEPLGKFELPIMAAVQRLHGNGYSISIMDEVSGREKRKVSYGAVHATLSRLQEKGYLSSKMGDPTPERGGRRKKFYEVTGLGESALAFSRATSPAKRGLRWLAPSPAGS